MGLLNRLQHAWNAFFDKEEYYQEVFKYSDFQPRYSSSSKPDRITFSGRNERSIVTAVYNRIAIDCAAVKVKHVRLDKNDRYIADIDSQFNECLTVKANKDQSARAFIQDVVTSLLDEGSVTIVPIDATADPRYTTSYDIGSIRTGKILQWFPDYIEVEVYNDRKGCKEHFLMPKMSVAIIENPLYAVTNAPNSTLQRLIRKLNILDAIDEQSGSGKLDLIIQLPYIIKSDTRRAQAEQRRKDIEEQLSGSKYGIAYTDGTEHITQLNRSVENNLMKQIEFLTSMLYSQLGITQEVLNGTADEKTMLNYMNRTIEPIVAAIVDEMNIKFISKTARTQKQKVMFFNDPFRLITITNLSDIADKFTRNEILSSNEIRQIIGMRPVDSPLADELRNKNINAQENQQFATTRGEYEEEQYPQEEGYYDPNLEDNGGNQNV